MKHLMLVAVLVVSMLAGSVWAEQAATVKVKVPLFPDETASIEAPAGWATVDLDELPTFAPGHRHHQVMQVSYIDQTGKMRHVFVLICEGGE